MSRGLALRILLALLGFLAARLAAAGLDAPGQLQDASGVFPNLGRGIAGIACKQLIQRRVEVIRYLNDPECVWDSLAL